MAHADVPVVGVDATVADVGQVIGDWELAVVVNEATVVVGIVRREVLNAPGDLAVAEVRQAAPPSVRPSIPIRELAASMDEDGEHRVLGVPWRR